MSVSDSGVGIHPEDMQKIFEPFYSKKKMGRSGTGLGMSVVWETVKDHKGYIDVDSEIGKGTTFTLYFPVTQEKLTKDQPIKHAESINGKGESILIVDDVKEQREIAAEMLNRLGYQVSTVSSGEEALSHIKNFFVDLLILDMYMDPGMDGLDTYRQVLTVRPNQKAIITSGYAETLRIKEAQELGAGMYLKKPYLFVDFALAIRSELDKQISAH